MHPNEYSQESHYEPFSIKLDRCAGSCDTLNDLSNKVCIPNKTEDLNLSVLNMTTGINESKILTKHLSCECEKKFDVKKCKSNKWWNNNKCRCECKKHTCEKYYIWNPSTCSCENGKYLASIRDDSTIICDEVIRSYDEKVKTIPTNFNGKKVTFKTQKSLYFTCIFINYYNIIDSYYYLLLSDKISSKKFITTSRHK